MAVADVLESAPGAAAAVPAAQDRAAGRRPAVALAILKPVAVPLAALVVWEILSRTGVFAAHVMPAPTIVVAELYELHAQGELLNHILITLQRVAIGFFFGTLAATVLGAMTGYWKIARELLDPTIQALKAVPSLAWVPLFILWFGIFETSKVTLIAVGVFFPVYLSLLEGIRSTDRKLVEVGHIYNFSTWQIVWRILLPATLPSYVVGLRSGLALGWMFVIAAELMGASEGLGFLMIDGQMTGRPAVIIGSLILFAICGKATDLMLTAGFRPLLAWQDSFGSMRRG